MVKTKFGVCIDAHLQFEWIQFGLSNRAKLEPLASLKPGLQRVLHNLQNSYV